MLTIITTSLATENNHNKNTNIPTLYKPKKLEEILGDQENDSLEENPQRKNQSPIFSEKEITAMETVFKSSPEEAQYIINHLQDSTYFPMSENYRSVIFVGEPGTGKTTSAKYIIHKMSQNGWDSKDKIMKLIDEAWILKGDPLASDPYAYLVDMKKIIGTKGETTIRIIVKNL